MAALNNITICGRLTRDPETRSVGNGDAVCGFSVAVDRRGKKDETDFFDVAIFGKTGEAASQYLRKGQWVALSGSMISRKDDQKRTWWTLRADSWSFVGAKPADTSQADRQAVEAGARASGRWQSAEPDDDEIPPF